MNSYNEIKKYKDLIQLNEDDGRITSSGFVADPARDSVPQSDQWTPELRASEARKKKQDILKQIAQLGEKSVEFIWAGEHNVFMNKDQILDYIEQTVEDPDLTALEYMHNNGYSIDGLLKGMLKSLVGLGLKKADIFSIFKSARRGETNPSPVMIGRVAKQVVRDQLAEGVSNEKTWIEQMKAKHPEVRFIQAKMVGAPIRAIANGKEVGVFETPKPVDEARAASSRTRAGLARLAQINAMSPEERAAYDKEQADKVRQRDDRRAEKERAEYARRQALKQKPVSEGVMKDISALYNDWMSSEFAPFDSDAGDDREVLRKAEAFLDGQVAPEKIDVYAEMLADQYHGNPLGSNGRLEESADIARLKALALIK